MKRVLIVLTVLFVAGLANAYVITDSDAIALQRTNFNKDMSISQFDPSLGTLQSVKLTFTGDLCGKAAYENFNAYAVSGIATASLNQNLYEIKKSDNTVMLSLSNSVNNYQFAIDNLAAFDGILDFGGTSGATVNFCDKQDIQIYNYNLAGDLAYFTGLGNILWNVQASGTSSLSTNISNLIQSSGSWAGASVVVEYTYIPEPATISMLALGVLGLLKKRKA